MATVIVRLQNAAGELIDPNFSEFFDAKTLRTARVHAKKFCERSGLSVAAKSRLDNYEYWNALTEREERMRQAHIADSGGSLNWTRSELIQFLMDEGQRAPRRSLRGKSMEWLAQEAIIEGAREFTCAQCGGYRKTCTCEGVNS